MIEVRPPVAIYGTIGEDGLVYFSAASLIADMRRESDIHNDLLLEAIKEGSTQEAFVHGIAAEKLDILADQYDLLAIEFASDAEEANG